MAAEEVKAARIRSANDFFRGSGSVRVANDFGGREFTVTNTSAPNILPDHWSNRWVIVRNIGANPCRYAFSPSSTAEVAAAPTATAAGETDKVGDYIAAGEVQNVQLPNWDNVDGCYFVRITVSGTSTITMRLGDAE